jgi:hypothetical protein
MNDSLLFTCIVYNQTIITRKLLPAFPTCAWTILPGLFYFLIIQFTFFPMTDASFHETKQQIMIILITQVSARDIYWTFH